MPKMVVGNYYEMIEEYDYGHARREPSKTCAVNTKVRCDHIKGNLMNLSGGIFDFHIDLRDADTFFIDKV